MKMRWGNKYEARIMNFRAKGWLMRGVKQHELGGIKELAARTIEWALGLARERPSESGLGGGRQEEL